jgi:hypothetical protein
MDVDEPANPVGTTALAARDAPAQALRRAQNADKRKFTEMFEQVGIVGYEAPRLLFRRLLAC